MFLTERWYIKYLYQIPFRIARYEVGFGIVGTRRHFTLVFESRSRKRLVGEGQENFLNNFRLVIGMFSCLRELWGVGRTGEGEGGVVGIRGGIYDLMGWDRIVWFREFMT
jgi:hypothetical protein